MASSSSSKFSWSWHKFNFRFFFVFLAWAFLSGIHGEEMLKPEDAYAFRNTMLICIGVGFVASIGKVF